MKAEEGVALKTPLGCGSISEPCSFCDSSKSSSNHWALGFETIFKSLVLLEFYGFLLPRMRKRVLEGRGWAYLS